MRRYTPSLERVWDEWYRRERLKKHRASLLARGIDPDAHPRIPDNSEPWLKHPPRSIDDLLYVSDSIANVLKEWEIPRKILSKK